MHGRDALTSLHMLSEHPASLVHDMQGCGGWGRERCCSSGAVEQAARQSTGHNGHAGRTAAQHDDGAKRAHEHDLKCATFRSVYGTFTVPSSGDAIVVVSPLLPLTLHVERNSHSVVLPPVAPMVGRSYDIEWCINLRLNDARWALEGRACTAETPSGPAR